MIKFNQLKKLFELFLKPSCLEITVSIDQLADLLCIIGQILSKILLEKNQNPLLKTLIHQWFKEEELKSELILTIIDKLTHWMQKVLVAPRTLKKCLNYNLIDQESWDLSQKLIIRIGLSIILIKKTLLYMMN